MPTPSCDAVVIGGGPNGLACAGRLAQGGARVVVLDAAPAMGGAAIPHEIAPGFRSDGLAHLASHLDPRVEAGLGLARHGLAWADAAVPTTLLAPQGTLRLTGAWGERVEGLSADEAARWAALRATLLRHAAALAPFREITPPLPGKGGAGADLGRVLRLGLGLRRLGRDDLREFLRLALINAYDVAMDELGDDRLRGLLAFDATLGAWAGPRSPGTLMLLWNRLAGATAGRQAALGRPRGGMAALGAALARGAEAAGATLRPATRVAAILTDGDRATGVRLAGGEEIAAPLVLAAIDPRVALLDLLGARHLDTGLARRARAIRGRGGAARLHLALSGPPPFRDADPRSRLVIAPSADAVEAAWTPAKYGEAPETPVMEALDLAAWEPDCAPPGAHLLSVTVQSAPHDLPPEARAAFLDRLLAALEAHAPGLRARVAAHELLLPADLAARYGNAGGNWHHAELSVEQMLFLRPAIGLARYATPLPGLWLAGAGSHPGGSVSGAAGWNAATEALRAGGDR
jgi:phytoene dehydrogenase-like protein